MQLVGEDPDFKEPHLTGYFRDGQRRIDVVIVTKDTSIEDLETMKMTFLMNAINVGLDLEIETGSGEDHIELNFIKVHAPDHILQHYGLYYNIKKFFKNSHLEFVNSGVKDEKEMIKIIRRGYPDQIFSTFERSQIVYKLLLSVTFGDPENYIGINQLVDHNILLDVYPLHDGPFYLVPGQTALELNGRQALYYNWCGYKNMFRQIPLNVIREYLGERIGFFFAFYQFYNFFLLLIAIFGIVVFAKNYDFSGRNLQVNEYGMPNKYDMSVMGKNDMRVYKYPDLMICPRCADMVACPFRPMNAYKRELVCKVFLDNPLEYYMAFVTIIWGILLYILYIRKENYWYWMWETNIRDAMSLTRPEYRFLPKQNLKVKEAKPKVPEERVIYSRVPEEPVRRWSIPMETFRNTIAFFILLVAITLICIVYPSLMIELSNKMLNKLRYVEEAGRNLTKYNTTYPTWSNLLDPKSGFRAIERINHFVVVTIGSINGIFIIGMETVWFAVANKLIRLQAPRTELLHEQFHSSNLFGITMLLNFIIIAYYAFIKGALYTFPDDNYTWTFPLQLGLLNCGLLYCADEVFLVFLATFKTKLFYEQIMYSLTKFPTDKQKNPYEYAPPLPDRVACWEKEFDLMPLKEDVVTKLYNNLFLQIAMVTFFITVFPLTAIIAFLYNLWNMRFLARLMVVHSRRPLLVQTWGIGAWKEVLFILPYIACLSNAIYLVRNNSLIDRTFNKRYWSHQKKRRFFADYFMGFFNMSDYRWSVHAKAYAEEYRKTFRQFNQTKFCMFPGQYGRVIKSHRVFVNTYTPMSGRWYILWRQTIFVLAFMVLTIGIGILLHSLINPISEKVRDIKRVEEAVKQYSIEEVVKAKTE